MKLNIAVTLVVSLLAFYGGGIITTWYESFVFTFEPLFQFIPLLLVISWLPKLLVYGVAGWMIGLWVKSSQLYRWSAIAGILGLVLDYLAYSVNELSRASVTELAYLIMLFFVPLFGALMGTKLYIMRCQLKSS